MSLFDSAAGPLSFPAEGIRRDGEIYRLPTADDVDTLAPVFLDRSIADEANMPPLGPDELRGYISSLPQLLENSQLLPLVIDDAETGQMLGGAVLHDFNWPLGQIEIGYWLFEHARGRGVATRAAGADLLQLYTGLIYRGPALVGELLDLLAPPASS